MAACKLFWFVLWGPVWKLGPTASAWNSRILICLLLCSFGCRPRMPGSWICFFSSGYIWALSLLSSNVYRGLLMAKFCPAGPPSSWFKLSCTPIKDGTSWELLTFGNWTPLLLPGCFSPRLFYPTPPRWGSICDIWPTFIEVATACGAGFLLTKPGDF